MCWRDNRSDKGFEDVEQFLRGALELEGEIARASAEIREQSKIAYGHVMLDARLALMAIIYELIGLRPGQPGKTSGPLSERLATHSCPHPPFATGRRSP